MNWHSPQKISINLIFSVLESKMPKHLICGFYGISEQEFFRYQKEYKLYKSEIRKTISHQKTVKSVTPPICFGKKTETYYSEEDMIKGIAQLVKEDINKRLGQAS